MIKKQCAIFDKNTKIYRHTRTLHFSFNGELLDLIEGCDYIESDFSPLNGLWKYNGNDFVEIIESIFYKKTDAGEENTIEVAHKNEYTQIPPLKKYNDGTTQAFNDDLEAWEYTFKGEELLAYEAKIELEGAKNQKINELEAAYEKSKKIKFVQAKNEEMNILDRDHFFDMISSLRRGEKELNGEGDLVIKRHINHQDRKELVAIVYFQRLVFYDKFMHAHAGMLISIRDENYCRFFKFKAAIEQCQTQDSLDLIAFNFLNPDGVLIDVHAEAESLLKNPETPDIVKQKIEDRRGDDGYIRLFYSY